MSRFIAIHKLFVSVYTLPTVQSLWSNDTIFSKVSKIIILGECTYHASKFDDYWINMITGVPGGHSMDGNQDTLGYGSDDDMKEVVYYENTIMKNLSADHIIPTELQFSNIVVEVNIRKKDRRLGCVGSGTAKKQILKSVSGCIKPGTLVAVMGASGAGKSTLLNVLSKRNSPVSGIVLYNGRPLDGTFLDLSAFVQQEDLFLPYLTVEEHLNYLARLRLPPNVTVDERHIKVDALIKALGLVKCRNNQIGNDKISGGERKRLSIASELITNPSVLFLDEPTSGLDSYMAAAVVELLKDLARQGRTIICTIHQPASDVYSLFDNILYLAEGKMAYYGPRILAPQFFKFAVGIEPPTFSNHADFFIQALAVTWGDSSTVDRVEKITETWKSYSQNEKFIRQCKKYAALKRKRSKSSNSAINCCSAFVTDDGLTTVSPTSGNFIYPVEIVESGTKEITGKPQNHNIISVSLSPPPPQPIVHDEVILRRFSITTPMLQSINSDDGGVYRSSSYSRSDNDIIQNIFNDENIFTSSPHEPDVEEDQIIVKRHVRIHRTIVDDTNMFRQDLEESSDNFSPLKFNCLDEFDSSGPAPASFSKRPNSSAMNEANNICSIDDNEESPEERNKGNSNALGEMLSETSNIDTNSEDLTSISVISCSKLNSQLHERHPWMHEFKVLLQRSWIHSSRVPMATYARVIQTLVVAFLFSAIFFRLENNPRVVQNKTGALFMAVFIQAVTAVYAVIQTFPAEKEVAIREYEAKTYRISTYYVSKVVSDMPYEILFPIAFSAVSHFAIGYSDTFPAFLKMTIFLVLTNMAASSAGYCVSAFVTNIGLGLALGPLILTPFALLAGFVINSQDIPPYFKGFEYISFFKYSFSGVLTSIFDENYPKFGSHCEADKIKLLQFLNESSLMSQNNFALNGEANAEHPFHIDASMLPFGVTPEMLESAGFHIPKTVDPLFEKFIMNDIISSNSQSQALRGGSSTSLSPSSSSLFTSSLSGNSGNNSFLRSSEQEEYTIEGDIPHRPDLDANLTPSHETVKAVHNASANMRHQQSRRLQTETGNQHSFPDEYSMADSTLPSYSDNNSSDYKPDVDDSPKWSVKYVLNADPATLPDDPIQLFHRLDDESQNLVFEALMNDPNFDTSILSSMTSALIIEDVKKNPKVQLLMQIDRAYDTSSGIIVDRAEQLKIISSEQANSMMNEISEKTGVRCFSEAKEILDFFGVKMENQIWYGVSLAAIAILVRILGLPLLLFSLRLKRQNSVK